MQQEVELHSYPESFSFTNMLDDIIMQDKKRFFQ